MIRSLRRRHRWMITVLAAAIVLMYLMALGARPERALQDGFEPAGDEVSTVGTEP